MSKDKEDVSITLKIIARCHQEVTLQAGVADPMERLHGAWAWEDLDAFSAPLADVEAYLASVQDPYTRGLATGVYLARCAERAGKLVQLPAPKVQ